MKIIGMDQSYTSSGIVILEDNIITHCEIFKTPIPGNKKDIKATYHRAYLITEHLKELVLAQKPDLVAIEGLGFGARGSATRDLAGLQFVLGVDLVERLGYDVEVLSPTSVKKFATGSGKADKTKMIESLPPETRKKFDDLGVKKTTGLADLTDAYYIAMLAGSKRK